MNSTSWFYVRQGCREGPISPHELRRLFQISALLPETLVWSSSLTGWTPASSVPLLRDAIPPPPAESPDPDEPAVVPPPLPVSPAPRPLAGAPHPWVRYWARYFDMIIFSVVFYSIASIIAPALTEGPDIILGLGIPFAWVFVEAMLLASWGTSPGKWLLKTRVLPKTGGALSFPTAIKRSFLVYLKGMGIGFPLATLVTTLVAYSKLEKNKETTWDRDCASIVDHQPIGPLRRTVTALFFVVTFLLMIAGIAMRPTP